MCMLACNGWGALDGACVHAGAGQGALACMRVGMHAAASEPPASRQAVSGRCM
jgi:hypothetical protein